MPIKLSDIVAAKRWIDVDIAGEKVKVAYKPNAITLRRSAELEHLISRIDDDPDIDTGAEIARMFCDLVAEWDIMGEDDEPYPISVESLQDFPANILTMLLQAVQEDVDGGADSKKPRSATSAGGSRQKGSLEPARNGSR